MSSKAPPAAGTRAGTKEWTGLAVLALPTLLLALDQSVLFLALPHLAESLHPTGTQTLWIMDVYGFMIAGFLVTMGTLGDRIGRRRLLMIGAFVVGLASLAAAYATSAEMLIVTRALLGVAAATLMPSTLALISNMFPDEGQRGRAIAVWASCFMAGTALGPVIGGVMLQFFWWGSVFLLGVPVMLILLVAAPLLLPEYRDPDGGKLDLFSVALSLAAILPVIYGLKAIARHGFQPMHLGVIVVGLVFGVLFTARQRKLTHPLMDIRLFRHGAFTAALLILMLTMATMGGSYLFITGFLQMVEGLSPVEAGLWMVPSAIASIVSAMAAPSLTKRMPMGLVVGGGLAVSTFGYIMIAMVDPVGGLPLLVAGFVVAFFGTGPIGALGTNLVVGSAPPEKGGSAASMSETSGEFGVSLGVAAFGSLGTAVYRNDLTLPAGTPSAAAEASRDGAEDAVSVAGDLPDTVGSELLTAAREAYTSGLNTIGVVCAVMIAAVAVIAVTTLRNVGASGGDADDSEGSEGSDDTGDSGDARAARGDSGDEKPTEPEDTLSR